MCDSENSKLLKTCVFSVVCSASSAHELTVISRLRAVLAAIERFPTLPLLPLGDQIFVQVRVKSGLGRVKDVTLIQERLKSASYSSQRICKVSMETKLYESFFMNWSLPKTVKCLHPKKK